VGAAGLSAKDQKFKNDAEAELARLRSGLLPGEKEPAPARSDATLIASASRHSADHATPPRTLAAAAAAKPPIAAKPIVTAQPSAAKPAAAADVAPANDDSDDSDHDEPLEAEDDVEALGGADGAAAAAAPAAAAAVSAAAAAAPAAAAAAPAAAPKIRSGRAETRKAPISSAQKAEIVKNVREVKSGHAARFVFPPPCASMRRGVFSALSFTLLNVIVWLPHLLWSYLGVPQQPPCPTHGFDCVVKNYRSKMARPRRFVCVFLKYCGWLVGSIHSCDECKEMRKALKDAGRKDAASAP